MSKTKQVFLIICLYVSGWSFSAFAANVTINATFSNITSEPINGTTNPPSCFDSRQPVTAPIPGANPNNNQIRYGNPFGGGVGFGCSSGNNITGNANFVNKSGMGHQGGVSDLNCPTPGTAEPIPLGVFTHYNNVINVGGSNDLLTGFDLNLSIINANNNISFSAQGFVFEETPNNGNCPYGATPGNPNACRDKVSLSSFSSAFVYNDGTESCALVVSGFAPCNDLTAANVGDFITDESTDNSACIVAQLESTTPVTFSAVSSKRTGNLLEVDWSTSSELFNVGFQLWGLDAADSKWEKLHSWLQRSGSGNAVEPQSYSKTVSIPRSIKELAALGISSVDNDGAEHYYGPFDVGQTYGNLSTLKPIAWDHIRAQTDAQMLARGYIKDRLHGYRKISSPAGSTAYGAADSPVFIEFKVQESGLYRITAEQILNAGADWSAVSRRDIAIIDHQSKAVVRHVYAKGTGSGQSQALGESGEIYFHAQGVDSESGLYTDSSVYRLVVDRYKALDAQHQSKRGITGNYSSYYHEETFLERDNQYSLNSTVDDPWLDTIVLSYEDQSGSYAAGLPVEDDALWDQESKLTMGLGRSSKLAPVDHDGDGVQDSEHTVEAVVLSPNGTGGLLPLGTERAIGSGEWTVDFTIPGNTPLTLLDGKAVVGGVFKPGTGYAFSEVHVDSIGLSYARPYVAKAGEDYLTFSAPEDDALGYEVTVPDTGWPMVFAHSKGNLVRLALESQSKLTASGSGKQRVVRFAALDSANTGSAPVEYWVSGKGGLMNVASLSAKSMVSNSSLLAQAAGMDLLVIAHPVFMTGALSSYADFKRAHGLNVAIIDYLEIVDAFGGGQPGPAGLTDYLRNLSMAGELANVLLVGGSSYDHTDKLGTGAMTFIPGHYGESTHSNYIVSDTPYVMDKNNRLFAAIGRWPVRTNDDLANIIANSVAWSGRDHAQGQALAIAENTVDGEGINFAAALDSVTDQLPNSWTTSKVYADEILANDPGLSVADALMHAKQQIITGLQAGPDVVLYNGHGTTSQLSNKGLFKAGDVAGINGHGAQLWLPMSCYMTYFESTHVNTLAHQLLFSGRAAGITGAMLLSNQSENIAVGDAVIISTVNQGLSIGDAVKVHKSAQNNPGLNVNLTHLGDPTLRM